MISFVRRFFEFSGYISIWVQPVTLSGRLGGEALKIRSIKKRKRDDKKKGSKLKNTEKN